MAKAAPPVKPISGALPSIFNLRRSCSAPKGRSDQKHFFSSNSHTLTGNHLRAPKGLRHVAGGRAKRRPRNETPVRFSSPEGAAADPTRWRPLSIEHRTATALSGLGRSWAHSPGSPHLRRSDPGLHASAPSGHFGFREIALIPLRGSHTLTGNHLREILVRGPQRQKRPDQQVQGDGFIRRFDLCDPALARVQQLGKLNLGHALLLPKIAHGTAELETEIHIGRLIGSQPQELFSRSNFPALRFQACLLLCIHLCGSYANQSYSASRRLQIAITVAGVVRVFFLSTSRITMASGSIR